MGYGRVVETVDVPAHEVRLSKRAAAALLDGTPVSVTRYGRRSHIVLTIEQFELIEPLLELLGEGVRIPAELLLTEADLELERLLAEDREPSAGERALIAEVVGPAPDK